MYSPWDIPIAKSSYLKLAGGVLQTQIDCLSLWIGYKSSTCKEIMTWIFYVTPNASKSYTMQEILGESAHKV